LLSPGSRLTKAAMN